MIVLCRHRTIRAVKINIMSALRDPDVQSSIHALGGYDLSRAGSRLSRDGFTIQLMRHRAGSGDCSCPFA